MPVTEDILDNEIFGVPFRQGRAEGRVKGLWKAVWKAVWKTS